MLALHVMVTALGVALGVFYPFISVILADRGFTPAEIGLVFSLGAVGFTIAVPTWGHLADVRMGRARTLQLCAIGAGAAVAGLLLPAPPLVIVALLIVFWLFESSWQPLADAVTVNALRGRDYARVRLFTSFGFAVSAIASGFLFDAVGYWPAPLLFALASLAMAASALFLPDVERADLAAHRRRVAQAAAPPREGAREPAQAAPVVRRLNLGSAGVALRVAPRLVAVLLAAILLHVGIISGFTFLPLRIEALGGSPADVALSAGLSATAEIPAMLVMGAVARRLGLRTVFVVSALIYAACIASWTVIEIPLVIVGTRMITGLAFSGVIVGIVMTIAEILPRDLQGTGQSLYQTSAFGIGAVVANVLGGVLYGSFGHEALFGVGAVLAVASAVIGWFAFPGAPGRGPGTREVSGIAAR